MPIATELKLITEESRESASRRKNLFLVLVSVVAVTITPLD